MSIDSTFRTVILCGAIALLAAPSAEAQRTKFRPALSLQQRYTDNVRYAGETDASDTITRVSLELPVEHELRTGSFSFSYTPSYEQYSDFEDLDSDEHVLRLGVRTSPSRTSALDLSVSFSMTQVQGDSASLDDADLFLSGRTDRDLLRATLGYRDSLFGRWNWRGEIGVADTRFDPIEGTQGFDSAIAEVEDRTNYRGELGFDRDLSSATSIGFGLTWEQFELDQTGDETVTALAFTVRHTLGRRYTLNAAVGAFQGSGDAVEAVDDDDERSGAQASLTLRRSFRYWDLGLSARHAPSSGGALRGTSTNTALGLDLEGSPGPSWSWGASSRFALRDPTDSSRDDRTSLALGARVERRLFRRLVGLRLGGNVVDQTDDADNVDSSYYEAHVGIVWYPLGWTKLGGRSAS